MFHNKIPVFCCCKKRNSKKCTIQLDLRHRGVRQQSLQNRKDKSLNCKVFKLEMFPEIIFKIL